jgi:hypothetical protein
MGEIRVALRELLLLHEARVVRVHEHVDARADPLAVGPERLGMRSLRCGDLNASSTFSRCIASSSGPLVSRTSASARFARASVTARCSTFSELARQPFTFTPYFFSKAVESAARSSEMSDV